MSSKEKPDRRKLFMFVALLAVVLVLGWLFRDSLSLEKLAERESILRDYQQRHPWLTYGLAFVLYVTVTGLSIPGATVLSLAYAWFFGFVPALILVSFASTLGATIAFLVSRYLLYDAVQQRFASTLQTVNSKLETEGPYYLFILRLVPLFPFFLVNLVMGLTPIRTTTFWWVSQLGMLPGTAVYLWAGASVPSLGQLAEQGVSGIISWQIVAAFTVLGLFPLIVRRIFSKVAPVEID